MAHKMREVNEYQTTNLKIVADEISRIQKGLSELSRYVSRIVDEKNRQKAYLSDLGIHMEHWGKKEEDATRKLQQIGIEK